MKLRRNFRRLPSRKPRNYLKEKWEKFWDEDEKQTGFSSLPGFFEVFPELKFKWPNWARRKDGSAVVECETDSDCPAVPIQSFQVS